MTQTPKHDIATTLATLSVSEFRRLQWGAALLVLLFGAGHYLANAALDLGVIGRATAIFDVGREDSLPTAFSILNLFIAAFLVFCVSRSPNGAPQKIGWTALAVLMLLLGVDEAASIHERFSDFSEETGFQLSFISTNHWVLFGGIFTLAMLFLFVPFLMALPRMLALQIIFAGGVFVFGALALELVGALMLEYGVVESRDALLYKLRRLAEEGCEIFGIVILNCAMFSFLTPSKLAITAAK